MKQSLCLAVLAGFLVTFSAWAVGPGTKAFYGDPPDENHAWCVHDGNRPLPPVVKPGDAPGQPPADAVVLFDGKNLEEWVTVAKGGAVTPAQWAVKEGFMEVVPKTGVLRTKKEFGACQLHIEWATPCVVEGDSQGRGNSGVFLMGKYEVQVLDSFNNLTYADGQAGSIYAQNPPQVNVCRGPGEWQAYDIIFHPTVFDGDKVVKAGTVTVIQNGVVVQDEWAFEGLAGHRKRPSLSKHADKGPLELQDHGNPTRFRNIWIRELPSRDKPTPEQVLAQRKDTAAKLRAEAGKSAQAKDALGELKYSLESLVYECVPDTAAKARKMADDYAAGLAQLDEAALKAREGEIRELHADFRYMNEHKLLDPALAAQGAIEALFQAKGLKIK